MPFSREIHQETPYVFRHLPVAYGETRRDPYSDDPLSGNTSHSPSLEKVYDWLEDKPSDMDASTWVNLERIRANHRLEKLYRTLSFRSVINIRLSAPEHGTTLAFTDINPQSYSHRLAPNRRKKADALLTRTANVALMFNPADCPVVNVAFYKKHQQVPAIAQIHAGAQGIQHDIIGKTFTKLGQVGLPSKSAAVYISPYARNYTLYGQPLEIAYESGLGDYLEDTQNPAHKRLSMARAVIDQLTESGVPEDQIETSRVDTMRNIHFYSQRMQSSQAAKSQVENPHTPPFGRNGIMFVKK